MSDSSPVKDYDLLVIDNNSTDNTANIVTEFIQKHPNIIKSLGSTLNFILNMHLSSQYKL